MTSVVGGFTNLSNLFIQLFNALLTLRRILSATDWINAVPDDDVLTNLIIVAYYRETYQQKLPIRLRMNGRIYYLRCGMIFDVKGGSFLLP